MFNIESVLADVKANVLTACDKGLEEGMEIIKEEAIKLSDERIYLTPLPSKYAKRTGEYRRSFKTGGANLNYYIENNCNHAIYVEYKHKKFIVQDAVLHNIDKITKKIEGQFK